MNYNKDVSEIVGNHVKKTPGDDTEAILHWN